MTLEINSPAANGAEKSTHSNLTKPATFPQAPILWQAHRQCFFLFQADPTPVNREIARIVAAAWSNAFKAEVPQ